MEVGGFPALLAAARTGSGAIPTSSARPADTVGRIPLAARALNTVFLSFSYLVVHLFPSFTGLLFPRIFTRCTPKSHLLAPLKGLRTPFTAAPVSRGFMPNKMYLQYIVSYNTRCPILFPPFKTKHGENAALLIWGSRNPRRVGSKTRRRRRLGFEGSPFPPDRGRLQRPATPPISGGVEPITRKRSPIRSVTPDG